MARKAQQRRGDPAKRVAVPRTGKEVTVYVEPDRGPRDFRGRHLKWDPMLGEEILARLSEGELLISILREEYMPSRMTVYYWTIGEQGAPEEFSIRYKKARLVCHDVIAESAAMDGLEPLIGETRTVKISTGGETQEVMIKRDDNVARSKLRADVKLRLLGMWDERYRQAAVRPPEGDGQLGSDGQPPARRIVIEGGLPDDES